MSAEADLFKTDFSRAMVVTMFLLPEINLKLLPRILALKPGTRVVSNTFDMGDRAPTDAASYPGGDLSVKLVAAPGISRAGTVAGLALNRGNTVSKTSFANLGRCPVLHRTRHVMRIVEIAPRHSTALCWNRPARSEEASK